MLGVVAFILIYGVLFGTVELIARITRLSVELTRKIVHIAAGLIAVSLPLFMPFEHIAILCLIFVPIMLISKSLNIFGSIHRVKRSTYGEVCFPMGILLAVVLFPSLVTYIYAVLTMALADGFASVIGQSWGRRPYKLWRAYKTVEGSATFLAITLVISFICLQAVGIGLLVAFGLSIVLAAILTISEAILPYGLDNLVIPPFAALLFNTVY